MLHHIISLPSCPPVDLYLLYIYTLIKYIKYALIKNRVGDDGVLAILQYRPSDLYLADSKETMMVEVGNNHDCRF